MLKYNKERVKIFIVVWGGRMELIKAYLEFEYINAWKTKYVGGIEA